MEEEDINTMIKTLLKVWKFISENPLVSSIIAGIISGLIVLIFTNTPKNRQKRKLKKANKVLDKGDTERAKLMFSRIIMDNKDDGNLSSNAHVGRAKTYLYAKVIDIDRTFIEANKAIRLNEENSNAYIVRGRAYSHKGEHTQAIADYKEALEHAITWEEEAYLYIGFEYFLMNAYDLAITNYNQVLEKIPNFIMALINRGNAYAMKRDFDSAIKDYNLVLKISSKNADALIHRGNLYYDNKDFDSAIKDYNRVLKIKPDLSYIILNNRALVYFEKEMAIDQAIDDFTKSINLNQNFVDAYYNRGNMYLRKKDYDRAIEDFTMTINLDPTDYLAYRNRALAFARKRNYNKAIEDHTIEIKLVPKDAIAYYNRGNTYDEKGDYDLAIDDLTMAINIDKSFAEAYNNRGFIYLKKEFMTRLLMIVIWRSILT